MKNKKILIIDDDSVIRNALSEFFIEKGFLVVTAENGKLGLEYFKKEKPDLTVLDLIMPVMSGVECLEHMKSVDKDCKVVVLTGYGTEDQISRLKQLGAADIVRKGIGFEDFLVQIEGVIKKTQPRDQGVDINPATIKILVADDDNVIRTLLVEFLIEKGFQVLNAKNGGEAYEIIVGDRPEIVFLDLTMPIRDGRAILTDIAPEIASNTKWVLITGHHERIEELNALKFKYQILKKPFSLETFESTVSKLLQEFSIKI